MIQVIREEPGRLGRQVWEFHASLHWSGDHVDLRLANYQIQTRESPRHKFKLRSYWGLSRSGVTFHAQAIPAEQVPWSKDIWDAAADQIKFVPIGPKDKP